MSKDKRITAGNAANAAATLYQGTGDIEAMGAAAQRIFNWIIATGGDPDVEAQEAEAERAARAQQTMAQAQANVQAAMPGTTVERDLGSEEGRWRDALINNPNDWYNNVGDSRATSGGGTGPDFRFKDDRMQVKGLFLNGKYGPAPAWVFEHLGLPYPGHGGGVPQPQPAPQPAPAAPAAVSQVTGAPTPAPF